ncbi:MAG: glycosyltransferase, partial [Planctomycetota bacterium]|nr:glycosyltransferase [Planctomycetota bacterium]
LGLPAEALLVGQVARLARLKGQDILLEAAPMVLARLPRARFALVGTGEDYHRLQNKIRQKGLAHQVFLLGFRKDVAAVMSNFHVAVLPSIEAEGSPVAIKEAMALAVPVVASDLGGNAEIIAPGHTGLLVPAGDPRALADALIALLSDEKQRQRLGKAGQQVAAERFRASVIARQYLDLFQGLAKT